MFPTTYCAAAIWASSSALGKGFREMHELGLTARMPMISVIQAVGSNPLVRSSLAENGGTSLERWRRTHGLRRFASAIRPSWRKGGAGRSETGGWCPWMMTEAEIAIAKPRSAPRLGCEPASAGDNGAGVRSCAPRAGSHPARRWF